MEKYSVLMDWENSVKMSLLPKETYRFDVFPTKIPMAFFTEIERKLLKHRRPPIAKKILSNKPKLQP